jgi:hypothetical protein
VEEADEDIQAEGGGGVSEWISVDDRMPENNAICLVCGKKGGMRVARAYVTRTYVGKSYIWWTVVGTGKSFNATHWMPLPEPPKEKCT